MCNNDAMVAEHVLDSKDDRISLQKDSGKEEAELLAYRKIFGRFLHDLLKKMLIPYEASRMGMTRNMGEQSLLGSPSQSIGLSLISYINIPYVGLKKREVK